MQKDLVPENSVLGVGKPAEAIIPKIQRITGVAREKGIPIIYICLSLLQKDPLLKRYNFPPHCITGTEGAEVIDELRPMKEDVIVPIPRADAFLHSNLEYTLKALDVDTIVITGITTDVPCLMLAMNAPQRGFNVILVSDACATYIEERHKLVIELLKKFRFVKVLTTEEVLEQLKRV